VSEEAPIVACPPCTVQFSIIGDLVAFEIAGLLFWLLSQYAAFDVLPMILYQGYFERSNNGVCFGKSRTFLLRDLVGTLWWESYCSKAQHCNLFLVGHL
jgi:hypothetical protein